MMPIPYLECAGSQDFIQAVRELHIMRMSQPGPPLEVMALFRYDTKPGKMGRWISAYLEATCLVKDHAGEGKPLYILRYREFIYECSEYDLDNPDRLAGLRAEAMRKFKAGIEAEQIIVNEGYAWSGE